MGQHEFQHIWQDLVEELIHIGHDPHAQQNRDNGAPLLSLVASIIAHLPHLWRYYLVALVPITLQCFPKKHFCHIEPTKAANFTMKFAALHFDKPFVRRMALSIKQAEKTCTNGGRNVKSRFLSPVQFYFFIKSLLIEFLHIRFFRSYCPLLSGSSARSDQWSSSRLSNRPFCRWWYL